MMLDNDQAHHLSEAIRLAIDYYADRATQAMPRTGGGDEPAEQPEAVDLPGACGWLLAAETLRAFNRRICEANIAPPGPGVVQDDPQQPTETVITRHSTEMAAIYNACVATRPRPDRALFRTLKKINENRS